MVKQKISSEYKKNESKYHRYAAPSDIYPHKHCPVCNKLIEEDEDYCSEECSMVSNKKEKGSKKKIAFFVVIYVVVIVLLFVFMLK